MDRCDHCIYRNGWECGDGWRVWNDCMCYNFKLDFDTLSEKQKKEIQRRLLGKEDSF